MLKQFLKILLTIAIAGQIVMFAACRDDNSAKKNNTADDYQQRKENLEKLNKSLVLKEKEDILNYVKSHNLNVEWIGTGLCYSIVSQGDTALIQTGDIVYLEYELRFLNDDLIYSSTEDGIKAFVVGYGNVEVGLEEAITHLHKNDVAVIIMPSNTAHGVAGDGKRIPPLTTLVYKVKIIENQSNKYNN